MFCFFIELFASLLDYWKKVKGWLHWSRMCCCNREQCDHKIHIHQKKYVWGVLFLDREQQKGLKEPSVKKQNENMANPIAVQMFYPSESKFTHGLSSAEPSLVAWAKEGMPQA